MRIQQISVFLENKTGRLAEVTRLIAGAGVNIRALSIADTAEFGILRLIVDRPEDAAEALAKGGFTTRMTDVLAVEIPDQPGSLAHVMEIFKDTGVNIEYLYASLEKDCSTAVVIFKVEDIDLGIKIATENKLSTVQCL
jgi:hypothetical protein